MLRGACEFSFAFQPIVDARIRDIVCYEALVRGSKGEPSAEVFAMIDDVNRYRFDQACRVKAIYLASRLNLHSRLSINLFPNAIYQTGFSFRATLEASMEYGFPTVKIIFEVTEDERVTNPTRLINTIKTYSELGFQTAMDDFGVGYSGLFLLQEYQPKFIKIDRRLLSDINTNHVKQTIVKGLTFICRELKIETIAEGVETFEEYEWLYREGINYFQGYYFARPKFEAFPDVTSDLYIN